MQKFFHFLRLFKSVMIIEKEIDAKLSSLQVYNITYSSLC